MKAIGLQCFAWWRSRRGTETSGELLKCVKYCKGHYAYIWQPPSVVTIYAKEKVNTFVNDSELLFITRFMNKYLLELIINGNTMHSLGYCCIKNPYK